MDYTPHMNPISRREALGTMTVVGASLGLTGCLPQRDNPGSSLPADGVRLAAVADFPQVGSFKELEIAGTPALLIRTAEVQPLGASASGVNLVALSRVCTHLGCLVNAPKSGVLGCPCHGSLFDAGSGAVKQGPAGKPLPAFKLEVRSGGVYAVKS